MCHDRLSLDQARIGGEVALPWPENAGVEQPEPYPYGPGYRSICSSYQLSDFLKVRGEGFQTRYYDVTTFAFYAP